MRNWVSVKFTCHGGVLRLVVPPEGRTATARCPVCGRETCFRREAGGSTATWFEVGNPG
ncbi:MAG: hypothetical protein IPK50_22185 [Fibrobacterota bacterium]|nr:hypothetical protein [Fibrobacterota bacterium]QQS04955.1 MAG: hypothetical protein IPK50_22185 [Fibrobacterota bacterium]